MNFADLDPSLDTTTATTDDALLRQIKRQKHCIRRAMERYGMEVDETTLAHIVLRIQQGRAGVIMDDGRHLIAEIQIGLDIAQVVYCRADGELKTFLPRVRPVQKPVRVTRSRIASEQKTYRHRRNKAGYRTTQ